MGARRSPTPPRGLDRFALYRTGLQRDRAMSYKEKDQMENRLCFVKNCAVPFKLIAVFDYLDATFVLRQSIHHSRVLVKTCVGLLLMLTRSESCSALLHELYPPASPLRSAIDRLLCRLVMQRPARIQLRDLGSTAPRRVVRAVQASSSVYALYPQLAVPPPLLKRSARPSRRSPPRPRPTAAAKVSLATPPSPGLSLNQCQLDPITPYLTVPSSPRPRTTHRLPSRIGPQSRSHSSSQRRPPSQYIQVLAPLPTRIPPSLHISQADTINASNGIASRLRQQANDPTSSRGGSNSAPRPTKIQVPPPIVLIPNPRSPPRKPRPRSDPRLRAGPRPRPVATPKKEARKKLQKLSRPEVPISKQHFTSGVQRRAASITEYNTLDTSQRFVEQSTFGKLKKKFLSKLGGYSKPLTPAPFHVQRRNDSGSAIPEYSVNPPGSTAGRIDALMGKIPRIDPPPSKPANKLQVRNFNVPELNVISASPTRRGSSAHGHEDASPSSLTLLSIGNSWQNSYKNEHRVVVRLQKRLATKETRLAQEIERGDHFETAFKRLEAQLLLPQRRRTLKSLEAEIADLRLEVVQLRTAVNQQRAFAELYKQTNVSQASIIEELRRGESRSRIDDTPRIGEIQISPVSAVLADSPLTPRSSKRAFYQQPAQQISTISLPRPLSPIAPEPLQGRPVGSSRFSDHFSERELNSLLSPISEDIEGSPISPARPYGLNALSEHDRVGIDAILDDSSKSDAYSTEPPPPPPHVPASSGTKVTIIQQPEPKNDILTENFHGDQPGRKSGSLRRAGSQRERVFDSKAAGAEYYRVPLTTEKERIKGKGKGKGRAAEENVMGEELGALSSWEWSSVPDFSLSDPRAGGSV